MRVAAEIVLTGEQKSELDRFARGRRTEARLVLRARIVLLAAVVHTDLEIAERLGVVPRTAARWRSRFLADGAAGLQQDAPRPGRTPAISAAIIRDVIEKTTQQKPSNRTHWSTRTMAAAVGISEASVRRIWRAHGLKPHRVHTFKLSNDPRFAEKLEDVVGLYLNPPEHALVLSLDEKSQIQALDRTQPGLPMKKGRAQTMTHDYKRYGTTTLFAALNTLDGMVMATCMNRHRHQEWLKFLRLIERFFRDLTENQLQRGVFTSVEQLQTSIFDYIQQHNTQPKPFIWTAKATDILEKVKRGKAALHNCPSA